MHFYCLLGGVHWVYLMGSALWVFIYQIVQCVCQGLANSFCRILSYGLTSSCQESQLYCFKVCFTDWVLMTLMCRYSVFVFGMGRSVAACLACRCVIRCVGKLSQAICSRLSWQNPEFIRGVGIRKKTSNL